MKDFSTMREFLNPQERKYVEWLLDSRGWSVDEAIAFARQPRPRRYEIADEVLAEERWDNVVPFPRRAA